MLGFIVPIKPEKYSKDWDLDNDLLERTANSICGQIDEDFKLIVVYTDMPDITCEHKNLHFLHYPYANISTSEITDWEDRKQWYAPVYGERMMDKSRKIMLGCKLAKELGCSYLMAVDSDDLVSNKLSGFVTQNKYANLNGWRISHGYVFIEPSKLVLRNSKIWGMNGSTHIIREDLVKIPDFETNYNLFDYSLFEGHAYTYQRLIFQGETLASFPFYGVVYVIHNNYSKVKEILSASVLKLLVKKVTQGRYLSKRIRNEFGLYSLKRGSL